MIPQRGVVIAIASSAVLTAVSILALDRPVAHAVAPYEPAGFWDAGLRILEWILGLPFFPLFAPVLLVVAMLVAMAVPRFRVHAPVFMVLAGTHVFARFFTGRLKDLTGRLRPSEWLRLGGDDTFYRDGIAFPSGHVALFASIVIPLAIMFPRARPLLVIVVYVCLARILANAHWVSDTLGAITLVTLVAWMLSVLVRPRQSRR